MILAKRVTQTQSGPIYEYYGETPSGDPTLTKDPNKARVFRTIKALCQTLSNSDRFKGKRVILEQVEEF